MEEGITLKRKWTDDDVPAHVATKQRKEQDSDNGTQSFEEDRTQEIENLQVGEAMKKKYRVIIKDDPDELAPWTRRIKLELKSGEPLVLGRSKLYHVKDKRVSIQQVSILQPKETDDYCILTMKGKNPSAIQRNGAKKLVLIRTDESESQMGSDFVVHSGDRICLLVKLFPFVIKVKEKKPPTEEANYLFYSGTIKSRPHGEYIDEIHKKWKGEYELLERHHGYIQWLFPIFEANGMNSQSKRLKKEEAKLMREDQQIAERIVRSYRLMLDFFGLVLVDPSTGQVQRGNNWKERFQNWNDSFHNNLRITRILCSLGHLGFSRYKKPLVDLLTKEIEVNGELQNCKGPLNRFWKLSLDVNSKWFKEKTREDESDRVDSVFFKSLKK